MAGSSLREALESAVETHEEKAGGSEEGTQESLRTTEEETPETNVEQDSTDDVGSEGDGAGEKPDGEQQPPKKAGGKPNGKAEEEKEEQEDSSLEKPDKKGKSDLKAPNTWKAAVREKWKDLPDDVKQEILRREADIDKVGRQFSMDGQFRSQFDKLVGPYVPYLTANGGNVFQSLQNLMNTAVSLQTGSKVQKADLVKRIIFDFDVDIESLDKLLAGEKDVREDPQEIAKRAVKTAVEPLQRRISEEDNRQYQRIHSEVSLFFKDPKNEFAEDLRDEMADMMEMAARRGQEMTMGQAYERCVKLSPEIQRILNDRKAADLRRKKGAASSMSGGRAASPQQKDPSKMSLRESLEAAIEQHNR